MKRNPVPAADRLLSHYDARAERRVSFPPIASEFQPRHGEPPGGGAFDGHPHRPGFTLLTGEVLRAGASRTFRLEMTMLGIVALVSAWPIASMIHEVIRFLK